MSVAEEHRNYGTTVPPFNKPDDFDPAVDGRALSDSSSEHETKTAGVQAIEGISQAWTGRWLFIAYFGIAFLTGIVSLEQNTTANVTSFTLSAFKDHSLLATVGIITSVMLSVVKPPMAKLSDVIGRPEAFAISVFLYVLGYIQQASSNGFKAFASAQIFYSAGSTGVQILVQIFVADTTNLLWRAFYSTIPDIPFLYATWAGPAIAAALSQTHWRWAYGMWAILLPISFVPLFAALFVNKQKAKKLGYIPRSVYEGYTAWETAKSLWYDLDFFGLLLFTAFICLILIPLTIGAEDGWGSPSIISMFVVGGLCLLVFPFWERSKKLAPKAFFPTDMFRNRNVLVGTLIAFFYFMAFYLSCYPYFFSYLFVVNGESAFVAGVITRVFNFASTLTSIAVSGLIYYTAHYKYWVTLGSVIYTTGIGLMIVYRNQAASTATLVGCQICIGIGGGMLNVPAQLGVQASVSHQEVAAATAIFLTLLEVGGAVGNAISGAIWTNNLLPKLNEYLPSATKDQASNIFADFNVAGNYTKWPLGDPTRTAINQAYQETMHIILIVGVCVAALVIPLSLCMKNLKLDEIDQKVKGRVIGGTTHTEGLPEAEREMSNREVNPDITVMPDPVTTKSRSRWLSKRR